MSEHSEKILAVVESGDDVSSLAASWRRSRVLHRIHPDRTHAPERDTVVWRKACERDAQFIAVAQPYLDQLYQILSDADCAVFLADRDGTVLDMRTNRVRDPWGRSPDQYLGTNFSEQSIGTNAIGTCLAEQRGTIIRASQHFVTRYTHLNSFGAPIFGPRGDAVGCLVISENAAAHDARLDAFLSITLGTLARRIEVKLFAAAFPAARLVRPPAEQAPLCAFVAVDRDQRLLGATRSARRMLALSDDAIAQAISLDAVLESDVPDGGLMAAAERRAIEYSLSRSGGNISVAAKTMGISRSTLYRKIAIYEVGRPALEAPLAATGAAEGTH